MSLNDDLQLMYILRTYRRFQIAYLKRYRGDREASLELLSEVDDKLTPLDTKLQNMIDAGHIDHARAFVDGLVWSVWLIDRLPGRDANDSQRSTQ
jgi:hypothetical protein